MKNLTAVVHDHSIIDQEMVDGYLKPFSDDQIFRGIFRLIRHREGDLASDVLKKMETPVLLIWGGRPDRSYSNWRKTAQRSAAFNLSRIKNRAPHP